MGHTGSKQQENHEIDSIIPLFKLNVCCQDQDQERSLYLTLWGTMPQIKNKRLVKKQGNSQDYHSSKSYMSNFISITGQNQTQYHLQILKK